MTSAIGLDPAFVRSYAVLLSTLLGLLAGPAAATSVDSELAYHRGVVAYGEGKLEQASSQFERVLAEDPDDASVLQYLGLIAARQGAPDDAIELFKRAVGAAPDDPEIRSTLGVALLHRDRAGEAAEVFDRVLAVEPDNAQAEFYAGVADYRRQRYPETVQHMQAALGLDPSLRMQSRYYIGLAEVFMGNLGASTAAFADAASISPSDPLAVQADMLGKRIQSDSRWWGFDVMTGIEFDSNPTFVGSNVDVFDIDGERIALDKQEDVLGVFSIDTYYDLVDRNLLTLRIGYSGFLSKHHTAEEVDQLTHVGWANLGIGQGDLRFGARFDISTTDLDLDEDYLEMRRVSPSITYWRNTWGVTQLLYQYQELDYRFSNGGAPSHDPDGTTQDLSLNQFIYLPAPFTYMRAGIAYERARTDGTEFEYDGVAVALGAGIELPYEVRAGVLVQYYHRDYKNRSVDLAAIVGDPPRPRRDDDIARLKLDLSVPLAQYWEFALRGAFTFIDSNIADYDYNRHVVGAYVSVSF